MAYECKYGIKVLDTVSTKRNKKLTKLHGNIKQKKWNKLKAWSATTNKITIPNNEYKLIDL
jgi:hypothetical protein